MTRKIVHLDMDAFYASVEQRDDPSLRGRPVVVGGTPDGRGVVAAASYEARAYGVRSAMPAREARRRCPDAVFLRPDMARYVAVSRQIRAILHEATALVEPLSIDEAFLDVTDDALGLGSATEVAAWLRARIHATLGLTASCGVGPNKLVAKIASDQDKPDGLTVVPPERVLAFLHPLPVTRLWGVGPATAQRLQARGLRTIGDVAQVPAGQLEAWFGRHGASLAAQARGEDDRPVRPHRARKSRGAERTFSEDRRTLDAVRETLVQLAEEVAGALDGAGQVAGTVTVKVRYADFTTVTRSGSLSPPTADVARVVERAEELLLRTEVGRRPVRLVGCSLSGLADRGTVGEQLALPWGGLSPPR